MLLLANSARLRTISFTMSEPVQPEAYQQWTDWTGGKLVKHGPNTGKLVNRYRRSYNGATVEMQIGDSLTTFFDSADLEKVLRYFWYARRPYHIEQRRKRALEEGIEEDLSSRGIANCYAGGSRCENGIVEWVLLHRLLKPNCRLVLHSDGNGLNNRQSNPP